MDKGTPRKTRLDYTRVSVELVVKGIDKVIERGYWKNETAAETPVLVAWLLEGSVCRRQPIQPGVPDPEPTFSQPVPGSLLRLRKNRETMC